MDFLTIRSSARRARGIARTTVNRHICDGFSGLKGIICENSKKRNG